LWIQCLEVFTVQHRSYILNVRQPQIWPRLWSSIKSDVFVCNESAQSIPVCIRSTLTL
jgi:hypothetical protein